MMSGRHARAASAEGAAPSDRAGNDRFAELAKHQTPTRQGTQAFSSVAASATSSDINRNLLLSELEKMAEAIVQTQREIAGIKPKIGGANRVASASEELSIVVSATEEAAASILSIAERLQQIETELSSGGAKAELCSEIGNHATNLMLACSFQDVTGQRMQKAAKTLQFIEERINGLIEIWGVAEGHAPDELEQDAEAVLLNGPSREGEGVSQEEIDRLIAE